MAQSNNLSHVVLAQEGWHPVNDVGYDSRLYKVNLSNMYWVGCAKVNGIDRYKPQGSITEAVFEEISIPDSDPDFEPILSPMRMLNMGIFGNAYFGSLTNTTNYPLGKQRWELLPSHDLIDDYVGTDKPKWDTSYFQKKASSTREWWLERNLISEVDPLGQFEWYCWYWLGRRIPTEDAHQIKRWLNFRTRQTAMLESNRAVGLQQALLHWSINPWVIY